MKKLFTIFILLLIGLVGYGQAGTQKIRNNLRIMDDLTVDSTLTIALLSTSTTTVTTFTSTVKDDTLETSDVSTITISTLTANTFVEKGTINWFQSDGMTSLYVHVYNLPEIAASA